MEAGKSMQSSPKGAGGGISPFVFTPLLFLLPGEEETRATAAGQRRKTSKTEEVQQEEKRKEYSGRRVKRRTRIKRGMTQGNRGRAKIRGRMTR